MTVWRLVARCAFAFALVQGVAHARTRTTILVPLDRLPSWRDMAFLAAVPAACVANAGEPSLIALDNPGQIGPEIRDYEVRYRPGRVLLVGDTPAEGGKRVPASSADAAAIALSKTFWKSSHAAVICAAGDYDSALVGSSVAALLKAPLLFEGGATAGELARLHPAELIAVGTKAPHFAGKTVTLAGASEAMAWVRSRGLRVPYLAAVNPLDRGSFTIRKLSLVGAELAAGRGGMVAPLRYPVKWKLPFESTPFKGDLPPGVQASASSANEGIIALNGRNFAFLLEGAAKEQGQRLWIDTEGDGNYSGPFESGDQVIVGGKKWAVSLGKRAGFGTADLRLTWPSAQTLCQDLRGYYRALGAPPENLCLVGFPDALPQAIEGHGAVVEEQVSDLPYAFSSDGDFATIGVGRVVAESASFGTLYAARVLTYHDLLSPAWDSRACGACWENTYQPLFENAGFVASFRPTDSDVPWATPPGNGSAGTRAPSFGQDSPLAECAALAHANHSGWQELGGMFGWNATVLIAPTVVESGGCGTACLDREPDDRSVVARLFRQGAVAFAGASREEPSEAEPMRQEFWNGVLAGKSLGQAQKQAQNSQIVTILDKNEGPGGTYRYDLNIRTLCGDPGLKMYLPSKPLTPAAHTTLSGDTVSVFAPGEWSPVKEVIPADWKWAGKDIYVVRGSGAYALSDWCAAGYNSEVMMVTAEFTTRRSVTAITPIDPPSAPLGWTGKWYGADNADGSHTYRFAVRLIDFDQLQGLVLNSVGRLDFRLTFGPS